MRGGPLESGLNMTGRKTETDSLVSSLGDRAFSGVFNGNQDQGREVGLQSGLHGRGEVAEPRRRALGI